MHWVDRGDPPNGLDRYRSKFTPRWISHFRERVGDPPTDRHWRRYRELLRTRFHGICGYCEEFDRGTTDHFRPKSKFPDRVYEWSNWVFACHSCNSMKSDKWPKFGYVDPCAISRQARPETFFVFDLRTGEICAHPGLSIRRKRKATQTIRDINLNESAHLKKRLFRAKMIELIVARMPDPVLETAIDRLMSPETELTSVTKAAIGEWDTLVIKT